MRRLVLEDPFSRAAIWSRNLALFAFCVALIGIFLARQGLDPTAALSIEAAALVVAALAVLCAIGAMVVIWRTGFRGVGFALGGLVLSALLMVYPAYLTVQGRTVPLLVDVSTDLANPPTFLQTQVALAARDGTTPPLSMGEADRVLQTHRYPDLQSLTLDANASDVDEQIHALLKHRRWHIVDETKPENFATGHIDVVLKTAVMGFPADLTFRIRQIGNHTQVDIRSVARGGWAEPGSNAARVQELVSQIEDANDQS